MSVWDVGTWEDNSANSSASGQINESPVQVLPSANTFDPMSKHLLASIALGISFNFLLEATWWNCDDILFSQLCKEIQEPSIKC